MKRFCPILALLLSMASPARSDDDAGQQFFESKVRPILVDQCYSCHSASAKKLKGGLYLDSREGALKGGETGPALVPGQPEKSRLILAVGYKDVDLQMPPKDKLSDPQIADLTAWVKMGAPWGKQGSATATAAKVEAFDLQKRKAEHWAWQPVRSQPAPAVKNTTWARDPIDQFILAGLEAKSLHPAGAADRRTLLRRVHFDLTGLPAAPAEVEDFANNPAPDALEKVIDRLLASQAFGERWGRHWLDLVRYSETMGHEFDFPIQHAWRYRDYVVRAFNADVPYDQFVTEHVAGDLLKNPRRTAEGDNESLIGTGFWFLGEGKHSPVDIRLEQADTFDNRIDVFGKTFQAVTIACARCHDHKFDAISTADYYALYGYVKGARYTQAAVNDQAIAAAAEKVKPVKEKVRRAVAQRWLDSFEKLPAAEAAPAAAVVPPESAPRPDDIDLAPNALQSWQTQGAAFSRARPGDFMPGDEKRPVASLVTEPSIHSGLLSKKLEGFLRSPTFTLDKRYLHVRIEGPGSRLSIVIDNFVIIRAPIYGALKQTIKTDRLGWHTIDLQMWQGRQAFLEIADTTVSDPGGPGSPPTAYAEVQGAVLSDDARHPVVNQAVDKAAKGGKPPAATPALRLALEQWRDGKSVEPSALPALASLLAQPLPARDAALDGGEDALAAALKEYRAVEQAIPAPVYVPAVADGPAPDECVFIRGNPKTLGPVVPRRFLEALDSSASKAKEANASSRLQLAQNLIAPTNPLTARVYVNRIWHHLFGQGIVASVDNFGKLGELPANSALLDHLADRFVKEGWSTKKLIRAIMLSATYQQASHADPAADQADPLNKLCHRQNVRRMEGEIIRDHLLAISGRLDAKVGGPSVPVYLTAFMDGRGRPGSGPLDGAGRRSLYIESRRNFLSPMFLAFDQPIPFNTMGRRSVSNVPAQALILMNDPFVLEQAKLWATKVLAGERGERDRLTDMYQSAFSRPPTADELSALHTFLERQSQELAQPLTDPAPWTDLAHALINTKEFIFVN